MIQKFTGDRVGPMQGGHTVEKKRSLVLYVKRLLKHVTFRTRGDTLGRDMNDVAESYSGTTVNVTTDAF